MNDPSEKKTKVLLVCHQLTLFGGTLKDSFFLAVKYNYWVSHVNLDAMTCNNSKDIIMVFLKEIAESKRKPILFQKYSIRMSLLSYLKNILQHSRNLRIHLKFMKKPSMISINSRNIWVVDGIHENINSTYFPSTPTW